MLYITVNQSWKRALAAAGSLFLLVMVAWFSTRDVLGIHTAGRVQPIRSVKVPEKVLALTFDVPWGDEVVIEILNVLKANNAKATFFAAGTWALTHPELLRKIVSEGHEIGASSYKYIRLDRQDSNVVAEEIRKAVEAIQKAGNGVELKFFRPPSGKYNDAVIDLALEQGYITVLWDIDSEDWKRPTAEAITRAVLRRAHPGAIVLFQASDSAKQTPKALKNIIEQLKSNGYSFLTLSDLLNISED